MIQETQARLAALAQGLQQLGWTVGHHVRVHANRVAEEHETVQDCLSTLRLTHGRGWQASLRPGVLSLSLARRGKDVWNQWRHEYPEIIVTFEGVNFDEPSNINIDFSGFEFGDSAEFSGCRFRQSQFAEFAQRNAVDALRCEETVPHARFSSAIFGSHANFSAASFGDGGDFSEAVFGDWANFSVTTFGIKARFSGSTFGDWANFTGATFELGADLSRPTRVDFSSATFGNKAGFSGATFGDLPKFSSVTFGNDAFFNAATFGFGARFSGSAFGDEVDFEGTIFGKRSDLSGTTFMGSVDLRAQSRDEWRQQVEMTAQSLPTERKQQYWNARTNLHLSGAGPETFPGISLARARFKGNADFSGRSFLERCDFTDVRFHQPPTFHESKGTGLIDLYGSTIRFSDCRFKLVGWTTDSDVATRLRSLRNLANETNNRDLERDLYIEERKAERGILLARYLREGWKPWRWARLVSHSLWILVMSLYWLLADYGLTFRRLKRQFGVNFPDHFTS